MKRITRFYIFTILLLISFSNAYSSVSCIEDTLITSWQKKGRIAFNLANVNLQNWVGGGESSLSLGFQTNASLLKETEKWQWNNTFDVAYGLTRLGVAENNLFKKTDDMVIVNSQFQYKFNEHWNMGGMFALRTQLFDGFKFGRDSLGKEIKISRISSLFAPGYIIAGAGVQYQNKYFTAMVSPISSKITIVADESLTGRWNLGNGTDQFREEIGANYLLGLKFTVMKNIEWQSRLNIFQNYSTPTLMDINFEGLILMKVNKYVTVGYATQAIYDHDIRLGDEGPKTQLKQVLTVNFGLDFWQ